MRLKPRIVIDTNVWLAALRSRRGSSFKLLAAIGSNHFHLCISVPLILEYEEVARRSQWKNKPAWSAIGDLLDYICATAEHCPIYFLWRPAARDPLDDMVLELALAAQCDVLVTWNKRDFAVAETLGVAVLNPHEFLSRLEEL